MIGIYPSGIYPAHAYPSARAFKKAKRKEIRDAIKGMDELIFGCMYSPAFPEIDLARKSLLKAKEIMSEKNWGR